MEGVMRSQGRVYKRCGRTAPDTGRLRGAGCPRLRERGHGSWYFAVDLPVGRDGRRHQPRRGGFRTRAAAEAAKAYLLRCGSWATRRVGSTPSTSVTI